MPSASTAIKSPVGAAPALKKPRGVWVVFDELKHRLSGRYVARKFYIGKVFCFDADEELRADTLDEVRKLLPPGLMQIDPVSDDHTAVEAWV